jgi:hypothetical protein
MLVSEASIRVTVAPALEGSEQASIRDDLSVLVVSGGLVGR